MDAIELLSVDHEKVRGLFQLAWENSDPEERRTLFQAILEELEALFAAEDHVFYPACAEINALRDQVEVYLSDHQEMKDIAYEIDDKDDVESLDLQLEELMEMVENHFDDEEAEFFPEVRRRIGASRLREIGARLLEAKTRASAA